MKTRFIQTLVAGLLVSGPFAANAYDSCCYNPCDDACCDWYVYADYLYFNACRSGLDYTISKDDCAEQFIVGKGPVNRLNDTWNSGVRVGLGYRCGESADVGVRYTYYQAKNNEHKEYPIGANATRLHPAINDVNDPFFQTNADYNLNYNVVDLEAGAWSAQGCDLKLRPFVGVRMAFVQQDMAVKYDRNRPKEDKTCKEDVLDNHYHVKQNVDMNAYGVMMGADGRYHLCDCFYLTGRVSSGALYGDFDYSNIQRAHTTPSPEELVNTRGHDCRAVFSSEVSLGLEFFLCDMCGSDLIFAFGYELHTMFDMVDFLDFSDNVANSKVTRDDASLMLHGLFVRLGASF